MLMGPASQRRAQPDTVDVVGVGCAGGGWTCHVNLVGLHWAHVIGAACVAL